MDRQLFILVCVGKGTNSFAGKPVAATFGIYRTMGEASRARDRILNRGDIVHFATDHEWIICQDSIVTETEVSL